MFRVNKKLLILDIFISMKKFKFDKNPIRLVGQNNKHVIKMIRLKYNNEI